MEQIASANFGLALGAILVLAGILSSLLATRFGTPLLLVFLVIGMLAGEDGIGGIHFDNYQATYLIGSCALAIILFDGGLRTKISSVRGALAPAVTLATAGVFLTAAIVGAFATLVFGFTWPQGLLLGAIVSSTDAAAVFFLLKTGGLQLRPPIGSILEIESGSNDPIAVFLAVVLTGLALAGSTSSWQEVTAALFQQAFLGGVLGLGAGLISVFLLNTLKLQAGLHPLFVVAMAIAVFAVVALLGGSGFLAVYVAGLVVGNQSVRAYPSIVNFHDTATWLCQIVMFLVLGLLVTPSRLWEFVVPGLSVAVFLILVGRPAAVWLCLHPFGFTPKEIGFISWVGLRGAVSIFLAAIPTLAGVPGADMFFNVAFFVVMVSLVVQGWTIAPAARRLGMALRRPAPPTSRIEIDLPGQSEKELVGYPIATDSFVALRPTSLPGWLKPVLVVRDKEVHNAAEAGELKVGDYAYFLVSPDRLRRLDRLFAALPPDAVNAAKRSIFGEFPIDGDAPIGDLAEFYGLLAPAELAGLTVREAFAMRHAGRLRAGSRIDLGQLAAIVARDVDGQTLLRAGLRIDDIADLSALSLTPVRPTALDRL
ncbi:MAG TPA: potassium/proton antiporter, partial [Methylomirabilota bacterium]|nr:potassium/proton antiporter [Methylomirabilota bacterium]